MAEQLALDLPVNMAFGREDFFVTSANSLAVDMLENVENWPSNKLILLGPNGAGKSHLASIWAESVQGKIYDARFIGRLDAIEMLQKPICLESTPQIAGNSEIEEHLFHLHNMAVARGVPLLMTGIGAVNNWGIKLPDLKSRLQGTTVVTLDAPDDALLVAVLVKQFADRQIAIDPKVVSYLQPRMERSFGGVQNLVGKLDDHALKLRKPITVKLAKSVLEEISLNSTTTSNEL